MSIDGKFIVIRDDYPVSGKTWDEMSDAEKEAEAARKKLSEASQVLTEQVPQVKQVICG